MQLDFITEGIAEESDEFEKWWSTRSFVMPFTLPDGTISNRGVQIALRKRRAYSLVFPKEALPIVINTLKPENCSVARVDGKGTKQFGVFLKLARKYLRLKPLPELDPTKGGLPIRDFNNMRIVGLGIREDEEMTQPDGTKHEGL